MSVGVRARTAALEADVWCEDERVLLVYGVLYPKVEAIVVVVVAAKAFLGVVLRCIYCAKVLPVCFLAVGGIAVVKEVASCKVYLRSPLVGKVYTKGRGVGNAILLTYHKVGRASSKASTTG